MITIKIKGLEKVSKLFLNLPEAADRQLMKVSEEFMRDVQNSAKLRAPIYTGFLKDQITLKKRGKSMILDTGETYYAYYQEFGFTPHMIPLDYLRQHMVSPNIPGQPVQRVSLFRLVKKSTPFMFPALQAQLPNLPARLSNALKKAIEEARR